MSDTSWIALTAVLVAWPLVGLGMAYLFGGFTHGAGAGAGDLAPPIVRYLRRVKRAKTPSRATTRTKARRKTIGGLRSH